MKKRILNLALATACMGLGLAFAAEQAPNLSQQKDECLLISKDCQNQTASIQEKIRRLQTEIQKGDRVYTKEELKNLQDKLKDTENTLDLLLRHQ